MQATKVRIVFSWHLWNSAKWFGIVQNDLKDSDSVALIYKNWLQHQGHLSLQVECNGNRTQMPSVCETGGKAQHGNWNSGKDFKSKWESVKQSKEITVHDWGIKLWGGVWGECVCMWKRSMTTFIILF